MNSKTTWSLLVIAALVFAGIVFFERPLRQKRQQKPDTRILAGLDVNSVTNVQVRPAGRFDIRAEKTADAWQMTRPVVYPAFHAKIDALVRGLSELRSQAHITSFELQSRPQATEEFGFDNPQFSIILQQGGAIRHVLVGSKTVVGDHVFVQIVGGDGFHLVSSDILKLLPREADEWRDPSVISESARFSTAIEVRAASKVFRLEYDATNRLWSITKPIEARANNSRLQDLVGELINLRVTSFIPDDKALDLEKFGLPNVAGQAPELELNFFRGTNLVVGLQVGRSPETDPSLVYVRRIDQNIVFLTTKATLEPWRAPYVEFRDRRLLNFPSETATNITVRGDDQFVLERENNGPWTVTRPERFEADADLVRDLLLVLGRIEVDFGNDVVTDFTPFGLHQAVLEYTVTAPSTNGVTNLPEPMTEQLVFGTNGTDKVFLRRNNKPRVYTLNMQEFNLLSRASWQLRDRRIWNFSVTNVVSVTIQQKGKTRKFLRNGENDWAVAPGHQGVINPFAMEEALHRLGELKAVFWTARSEEDRKKFGFEAADHKILVELRKNGGTETLVMEFGDYSAYYHPYAAVRMDGQRRVFEFPLPMFMEFIRKDLSIFAAPLPAVK